MVPQQSQDLGSTILLTEIDPKENDLMSVDDHEGNLTVFGSQLVVATSNTPYTDATQVSILLFYCFAFFPFTFVSLKNGFGIFIKIEKLDK